jgi:hypothetical protein
VLKLCLEGFDVPAKQVLRSMLEYSELLMLFDAKPSTMADFHDKQDARDSNSFWHANLSKGKARRTIEQHLSAEQLQYVETMREWWNQEKVVLGAATHPSLIACFAAYTSFRGRAGFLGHPTNASLRTLQLTAHALEETLLLTKSVRFWESDVPNRFFKYNPRTWAQRRAKEAWPVLISLWIWTLQNQESPSLSADATDVFDS